MMKKLSKEIQFTLKYEWDKSIKEVKQDIKNRSLDNTHDKQ